MLPAWDGEKIRRPTANRAPAGRCVYIMLYNVNGSGGRSGCGWACPGLPVLGLGPSLLVLVPFWALLLSAYTLAAFGDSSLPCSLPSLSVIPFCASPGCRAIIHSDGSGRGVPDFALLSFALSPFSLVYPPFSSAFCLICSVILSFCLSDSPF